MEEMKLDFEQLKQLAQADGSVFTFYSQLEAGQLTMLQFTEACIKQLLVDKQNMQMQLVKLSAIEERLLNGEFK